MLISVFTAIGTRVPSMKTGQGGNWLPPVLGPRIGQRCCFVMAPIAEAPGVSRRAKRTLSSQHLAGPERHTKTPIDSH
jgi:hypothetical protein